MPLRFAPNLTMLYTEVPFLERFARAAAAGFSAVEFLFPYEFGAAAIGQRLADQGLHAVLFNINPGDFARGERGCMNNPARQAAFRHSLEEALTYAAHFGCPRIHTMVGNHLPDLAVEAQRACAVENLLWAAPLAADAGVTLLIEPLNATDMPTYFVHSTADAMQIINAVNHPQVKLQYDLYHAQMTEGNLINTLTARLADIGHIQISDVPGRHQPGTGEINYPAIFAALERLGYDGYIGLEYRPDGETDASLAWLPRERRASTSQSRGAST